MKSTELLSPAGNTRNLKYALAFGADAVYAGMPRYSLRVRNNDFHKLESLAQGISLTKSFGKKFYLACNLLPYNSKVQTFLKDIEPVIEFEPDALIMADPGLIMMVRERWPELPVHLSVQANTMNYAGVKFWQSVGVRRIILSRELSLDDIEKIRQQCPDIELEVFVHGALCIAYSGRCLLSGYFNHRDANQGVCTNSCRWGYDVHETKSNGCGDVELSEKSHDNNRHELTENVYLLEEKNRPGQYMPIEEDEHGTYIMNSKDLRAIEHVERLVKMGINSLKIEGRTKSHYYVARTAQTYRQAIDNAMAGNGFDQRLLTDLDHLANRGYTQGFYQRHPSESQQNYIQGYSSSKRQSFVAEVIKYNRELQMLELEAKNKFALGDRVELITPHGNRSIVLTHIEDLSGRDMSEVPGGGYRVRIPLEHGDYNYGLLTKFLDYNEEKRGKTNVTLHGKF